MAKKDRTGNRKTRDQRKQFKVPELCYYLIVTDTEATERCFFTGLHQALPEDVRNKLVIKVVETKTRTMINKSSGRGIFRLKSECEKEGEKILFEREILGFGVRGDLTVFFEALKNGILILADRIDHFSRRTADITKSIEQPVLSSVLWWIIRAGIRLSVIILIILLFVILIKRYGRDLWKKERGFKLKIPSLCLLFVIRQTGIYSSKVSISSAM